MARFLDRAPGSGPVQDFDTTQADDYRRPFRSEHVRNGGMGGGVKSTDLVQRFSWKRSRVHPSNVILDPQVVFDETYQELVRDHGWSDAEATEEAYAKASAIVENAASAGMEKVAQRLQTKLSRLQRTLMNGPAVPNNSMLPVGASRPNMNTRTPSGMQMTGMGTSPSARIPETNGQSPRVPTDATQTETFTYQSVDGNEYTFTKRIKGAVVPEFTAFLSLLCMYELENGGSFTTPLMAARLALVDDTGARLFHPADVPKEPELEMAPGLVEVE